MTGADIKSARLYRGIMAKDVAAELGVFPSVYSRWENSQSLSRRVAYAALYAMQLIEGREHGH